MTRSTAEWIGRDDDARIPPRVRARVFLKYEGRCYLTGRIIRPGDKWQLDHIVALINGGKHQESNLAPVLVDAHKIKTREDVKAKSKVARVRNKLALGIRKRSSFRGWRKMNGEVKFNPEYGAK